MTDYPVPRATYRLQLHADFRFDDAARLAPYLEKLGVSHVYLSPILKARKGSLHGYDTVDHTVLNPELGTREDFERMASAFRRHGLGIVLDIVPNHMGVGGDENPLWLDVLEYGADSRFAPWFDIEWAPAESSLQGKVLVPFLGTSFGEALERGALELRYDATCESYAIWAEQTHKLPLRPDTYGLVGSVDRVSFLNSPEGRDALRELIAVQSWRPARYSVAADDINYRRFFINSDLAGIRVEREDVFEHVHRLVFELVVAGHIDGFRVDHIDGLYDPKAYCLKLRERCPRPVYLVVEKILAGHEKLREDWQVDGTTGYEFATAATRLLTDSRAEDTLTGFYERYVGASEQPDVIERAAKLGIVDREMAAELDALATRLRRLAAATPATADLTHHALRAALREVVVSLPVYRTYVDGSELDPRDVREIAVSIATARRSAPWIDSAVFNFLEGVMKAEGQGLPRDATLEVAMRLQQYTGPVVAKGLEDTTLYRYNRLVSLSDVGERPGIFASPIDAFHEWCAARQREVPRGLLGSSSHDSKRGEDTRARISAISGYARDWTEAVLRWDEILADAPAIDANDRYMFYQLLLGAWPAEMAQDPFSGSAELKAFADRLDGAMLKSVREAREHTSWTAPDPRYEKRVSGFVAHALASRDFLTDFTRLERLVGPAGAQNGLVEAALKLTVPGVPDIYQGAELWEQSMVDPDNRRAVNFDLRAGFLDELGSLSSWAPLVSNWRDGRVKLRLVSELLRVRKAAPELFEQGSYEPVPVPDDAPVTAFLRRYGDNALLVAVRLAPWRASVWDQRSVLLPLDLRDTPRRALLGAAESLSFPDLFGEIPVAAFAFGPLGATMSK